MRRIFILFIIAFFIYSCSEENDLPTNIPKYIPYGSLEGFVLNMYGQPLENTILEVDNSTTKTDSQGRFNFKRIKTGVHTISAFKDFYLADNSTINIRKDSLTWVTFELKAGNPYLRISDSIFVVNGYGDFVDVPLESNSGWIIKNNSSWIKVSTDKGDGNSTIRLSWNENVVGDEYRSDSVLITAGDQSIYLKVVQSFPLRIKEVKGIIGNLMTGVSDSVLVVFNQPFEVSSITSNDNWCLCDIKYTVHAGNSLRFTYDCADIGGEYSFTINLKNSKENLNLKENIVVSFYDTYVELEGVLKNFKLSEDEKYCWVTTYLPNRLYCIDIKESTIKSAFNLDFEPGTLAYNPYNGYWYVLPSYEKYFGIFSSCFYVVNPENGKTVKTVVIEADKYDHPQLPYVHPHDIVFSDSGLGVIVLKSPGHTGDKFRMIESYNDDKMWYHTDFINRVALGLPHYYDNVYLDYNKEIIAAGERENSLSYITKDEVKEFIVDGKFRSNEYFAGGVNCIKRFNKLENKYYVAASPGSQCIINLDNDVYSNVLLVESRGATADFSYRPGDNNIIFHEANISSGSNLFHILDFNQNKVVMKSVILYDLKNITTLKDGNTMLMTKVNYNKFTTRFYKFQTDMFFNNVKN